MREKAQYALTFGVIATMLVVAGFPFVVVFFFGVFAYFLWKTFSQPARRGINEVFDFYLASNEILRDDDRRWFGFEVQSAIEKGESILRRMHGAPPLVYFALGALYHKLGEHAEAVSHLAYVIENRNSDESTYLHPSGDLREYVTLLRKIERDPKEAPQTSSAVRTLERLRKNKGEAMLAESRARASEETIGKALPDKAKVSAGNGKSDDDRLLKTVTDSGINERESSAASNQGRTSRNPFRRRSRDDAEDFSDRKPITEVLHDIYDKKVQ